MLHLFQLLCRQFKEMRENDGDTSDMLDAIEAFFEESGKTRRQIAKKLKAMNLIQACTICSPFSILKYS